LTCLPFQLVILHLVDTCKQSSLIHGIGFIRYSFGSLLSCRLSLSNKSFSGTDTVLLWPWPVIAVYISLVNVCTSPPARSPTRLFIIGLQCGSTPSWRTTHLHNDMSKPIPAKQSKEAYRHHGWRFLSDARTHYPPNFLRGPPIEGARGLETCALPQRNRRPFIGQPSSAADANFKIHTPHTTTIVFRRTSTPTQRTKQKPPDHTKKTQQRTRRITPFQKKIPSAEVYKHFLRAVSTF
ncbi:unnamed protein product, partial [Ectocarpus sp. 6 AP-2014]